MCRLHMMSIDGLSVYDKAGSSAGPLLPGTSYRQPISLRYHNQELRLTMHILLPLSKVCESLVRLRPCGVTSLSTK
jgi:hypothetical protein